jgi:uncharacterized membrane protein YphA (DoxX/SURF4 family)
MRKSLFRFESQRGRFAESERDSHARLFLGCGLFTHVLAASAALGMAGALYTSVRLGEDWLRAAVYLIVFSGLSLTGPGKLSVD